MLPRPHNPSKKLALIDMDGTIADHHAALHRELRKIASPDEPPVPSNPHSGPEWIEARVDLVHQQKGFWASLEPIPHGLAIAKMLQDLGYDLHVLTKGPALATSAWTEKRDWCHKYLDPGTPVTITEDKGIVFGDVLFDDFPPYIIGWLEKNPKGLVLMLDYEYNRNFSHSRVYRVTESIWRGNCQEEIRSFLAGQLGLFS